MTIGIAAPYRLPVVKGDDWSIALHFRTVADEAVDMNGVTVTAVLVTGTSVSEDLGPVMEAGASGDGVITVARAVTDTYRAGNRTRMVVRTMLGDVLITQLSQGLAIFDAESSPLNARSTANDIEVARADKSIKIVTPVFTEPPPDEDAPSITSASSVSVAENSALLFAVTTDEAATVVIGGTDAAHFELASNPLSTSRNLRFVSNGTKSYNSPDDANADHIYSITLTPTDGSANVGSAAPLNVTVTDVNEAPTVANPIPNQTATVGVAYSYQFASNTFNDQDGDTLTYTATLQNGSALPTWVTFTAATRTFAGEPESGDLGSTTWRVTATDPGLLSVSDDFTFTVSADPNKAPTMDFSVETNSQLLAVLEDF